MLKFEVPSDMEAGGLESETQSDTVNGLTYSTNSTVDLFGEEFRPYNQSTLLFK